MAGPLCVPMDAQGLIRAIDRVSSWSGKAFAWLIVALTLVVCVEVFKRYILNRPTAWIFDLNNFLYGTLFMMTGAYTLAPGAARPRALLPVLRPGHPRADLRGVWLRRRLVAHRRAFDRDRRGATHLPLPVRNPDRGGTGGS